MFGLFKKTPAQISADAPSNAPAEMNDSRLDTIHKRIRRIEILTQKAVNDVFAGQYHSNFKGRGMEFAEVREYMIGDPIRDIDWNVTARLSAPHVKKYQEERELTVFLLVDVSSSFQFGTRNRTKAETSAEIAALLAFSAIQNNDKVGVLFFSDAVEKFLPPQKGRQHVLRVIQEILTFSPTRKGTNIKNALDFFNRSQKKRSICFLISDFYDSGFERSLALAAKKHDVIAFTLQDPLETEIPDVGHLIIEDAETGKMITLNTGSFNLQQAYKKRRERQLRELQQCFSRHRMDSCSISTSQDAIRDVVRFFKRRARRLHR